MKTYTNPEKGARIFVYCYSVVPELLSALKLYCDKIVENADDVRENWRMGDAMTADYWISVADDTSHIIEVKRKELESDKSVFVWELFETPRFFLVCDFIGRISLPVIRDETYRQIVRKLFPDWDKE